MKFIQSILGIFIAIIITILAVMNDQIIQIKITPLHNPLEYPLYMVMLSALTAGFLIGVFTVWLNMGGLRKQNRQYRRDIKTLESNKSSTDRNDRPHHDESPPHLLRD